MTVAFVAATFATHDDADDARIRLRRYQAREAGKLRLTVPETAPGSRAFVVSGPVRAEDLEPVRAAVGELRGRLIVVTLERRSSPEGQP
jgi:hypothetical protein